MQFAIQTEFSIIENTTLSNRLNFLVAPVHRHFFILAVACQFSPGTRLANRSKREENAGISLGGARETQRCSRLRGSRATDRGRESLLGAERLKSVLLFLSLLRLSCAPCLALSPSRVYYHVPPSTSLSPSRESFFFLALLPPPPSLPPPSLFPSRSVSLL